MAKRKTVNSRKKAQAAPKPVLGNILSIAIGIFLLSTFFTSGNDSSIGYLGSLLLGFFKGLFGDVLIFVSLLLIFVGIYGLLDKEKVKKTLYLGSVLVLFGLFIAFQLGNGYLEGLSIEVLVQAYSRQSGGGLAGALLSDLVFSSFGLPGIWIIMASCFIAGGAMLVRNIAALNRIKDYSVQVVADIQEDRQMKKEIIAKHRQIAKEQKKKDRYKTYENQFLVNTKLSKSDFDGDDEESKAKPVHEQEEGRSINIKGHEFPEFDPEPAPVPPPVRKSAKTPEEGDNITQRIRSTKNRGKWILPPSTLLSGMKKDREYNTKSELEHTARVLEDTLKSFGVQIQVKDINCGPAITRYEAGVAPGTKVSKIQGLSEDIALALAATSVRIEAPIPGKSAVGFEIPNKKVLPVSFKEIILSPVFKESPAPLTMGIGKDITGKTVATSLVEMPHLLIAGSTGSGKSVCLNTIICSLLYKYTPDELKFMLVDPKKVELNIYNDIPHLVAPVVTEPKKASTALKWMVNEMENRYQLMSDKGVRDIGQYNEVVEEKEKIPYVVIIIDELADLMMAAPVEVETYICRLAQKARAAGMHLIVATQRPSVQVITGDIKSNIPMRIAFAVFSQIDARTILDSVGAEKLLGKGDMLFTQKGGKLKRIQGAYISEEEIVAITSFLKKQGMPEYLSGAEILDREDDAEDAGAQGEDYEDELLREAARLVLESGQASISMLQRKLRVGYSRAARLIDMLEEKGFVGPFEGTKSREVTANWEDFGRLFGE